VTKELSDLPETLNDPYLVGAWCYQNNEQCPYLPNEYVEYAGYLRGFKDAAQEHRTIQTRRTL